MCRAIEEVLESRQLLSGSPTDYTYTLDADFDQGVFQNLNHNVVHNQLQINPAPSPFPFISMAASDRGTIVRVDTLSGQIIGEYWSAPANRGRNPSRTTVDKYGNVWAGNRNEGTDFNRDGLGDGSVIKIGLVLGGTRGDKNADGSFTPNPNGQYLQGPFLYNTCIDRDGDGLIRTSKGLGDKLDWNNTGDVDSDGGVDTALDEAILVYARTPGAGEVRHVSIDANNNVWAGGLPGYAPAAFDLLDGNTGALIKSFNTSSSRYPPGLDVGGYGGLVDKNGILWSASLGNGGGILRYDTNTSTASKVSFGGYQSYGMAVDKNGFIWVSAWTNNAIFKISPDGVIQPGFPVNPNGQLYHSRGVAVTPDNDIWVANSDNNTVVRLANSGAWKATISVGGMPTGVAVDAAGKVWVTDYGSSDARRIDPATNTVDLTVSLGAGAGPYNYSDMTGYVAIGSTSPEGTWARTQDSGVAGTKWGRIFWNTELTSPPPGTITVKARASESETGLPSQPWTTVANGVAFNGLNITGRYIQVQATLQPDANGNSPVLSDIRVQAVTPPPHLLNTVINDGNIQRSKIKSITVNFDQPVWVAANAISVTRRNVWNDPAGGSTPVSIVVSPSSGSSNSYIINFVPGPLFGNSSLIDGVYDLTVAAAGVTDAFGQTLGSNYATKFHRVAGDGDGDGHVDGVDVILMRNASYSPSPATYWYFDIAGTGDGKVDQADILEACTRLRKVFYAGY